MVNALFFIIFIVGVIVGFVWGGLMNKNVMTDLFKENLELTERLRRLTSRDAKGRFNGKAD